MLDHMADPHRKSKWPFRPPVELREAAQDILKNQPERDDPWTLNDVLVAALAMLVKRPKTFLRELEPFKPERQRGRPPKPRNDEGPGLSPDPGER